MAANRSIYEYCQFARTDPFTIKQLWPTVVWFGGGIALGQLAESVFFPLWSKLGLLLPIGHWLDSHGSKAMVWCWFVLWINVTSWSLAIVAGILTGLFTKHHLVLHLLLFGFGFAFVPLVLYAYLHSQIPSFGNVVQHTISIGLAIFSGLVSHKLAFRETHKIMP